MTLKSTVLVFLLALSSLHLSAQESSDLGSLTAEQLFQKFSESSMRFEEISSKQSWTLNELQTAVMLLMEDLTKLRQDFEALKGNFSTLKTGYETLLMELAMLESNITSLQTKADSLYDSLKNYEDDLRKAQNRATAAMVVSITVIAGVAAYIIYREVKR